jgi:hypothetical protein
VKCEFIAIRIQKADREKGDLNTEQCITTHMYQNVATSGTHKCHRRGIKLNINMPQIPQNKKKELLHRSRGKNSY